MAVRLLGNIKFVLPFAGNNSTISIPFSLPIGDGNVTATISKSSNWSEIFGMQKLKSRAGAVHHAVNSAGQIIKFYEPKKWTWHAPGRNSNSIGIEITNTGHPNDFYSGPQIDGVIQLSDYLMNAGKDNILNKSRQTRSPDLISDKYIKTYTFSKGF